MELENVDRVTWTGPTGNEHHAVKNGDVWRLAGDKVARTFADVMVLVGTNKDVQFHENSLASGE
jgi:hypothetical protein